MEIAMTKEVLVTIEGLQLKDEESKISSTASGIYHFRNGKHYIQYDEITMDEESITQNVIKITPDQLEIIRKGTNTSHMIFNLTQSTESFYQTPYGNLLLQIQTSELIMEEKAEEIRVKLQYTLSVNEEQLSVNHIRIKVISKYN
jgi:uncharacterized beta-barrel protein YwiB (DUF1934 family)